MSFQPIKIVVHHSLTYDGDTVSWGAIRLYHTVDRGWSDVGYHAGVEKVNGQYEAFYGRPITIPGAHTLSHNHNTLAICFVGDYTVHRPPRAMLAVAARRIIVPWLRQFGLRSDDIVGHRDLDLRRSCPGNAFDLVELRQEVLRQRGEQAR